MIYPATFEQKLGFDKIRNHLRQLCLSSLGQSKVDAMQFSSDFASVDISLRRTAEFRDVCLSIATFPVTHYYDLTEVLHKLRIIGSFPEIQEAFDLMRSLGTITAVRSFFISSDENKYPHLRALAKTIEYDSSVMDLLQSVLTPQGAIRDNASPRLAELRREISIKQTDVSKRVSRILKEAQSQGWVDNETSMSVRDGRLVLPVLAMYKRKVKGIVHDESATGKTVFIEPEEIVELNNEIRELEHAERREIVIILTAMADSMRPQIDAILTWYDFLATIDFIRAKALFSVKVESYMPSLSDKPVIHWYDARHPLLSIYFQAEGKKVVPLTLELNAKNRILIISGPNAGGKSVCLQTAGLLQYMLQCGMLVPAKPVSEAGIFRNIFIDIGDEQSIENDLSTYSSRLMNMKYFLKNAQKDTLILIDEFGSGTEPMIGGAIAESILDSLNKKQCFGVITTHYTNIKHYAMSAEGIVNGAMLYDTQKMHPLFVLQTGEPGSSFAFEIARKIGLPEDVLQDAEKKVGEEHIEFDKNLREIVRDKHYWERKRESIKDNEKKLDGIVDRYERELNEINILRKEILSKAKKEAEDILSGANRQIEHTIRTIKESQAQKEKTQEARKKLEEAKKSVEIADTGHDDRIARRMEQIRQRQERKLQRRGESETQPVAEPVKPKIKTPVKAGDKVRMTERPDVMAEVLRINGEDVTLAIGHIQMNAKLKDLEKISLNEFKKQSAPPPSSQVNAELSKRKLNFSQRIDVRGMRGDEAMKEITSYIDEALMVGVSELSILHGKGNGILRELIRGYLKTIDQVESYNDAHIEHGGAGITVVKFK